MVVVQEMMRQLQPSQDALMVNEDYMHMLHKMNETVLRTQ